MELSKYRVQIFDIELGEVVFSTLPGMAVEKDFVKAIAEKLGPFTRSRAGIEAAIDEVLLDLKKQVPAK